jgi:hypothetical protein
MHAKADYWTLLNDGWTGLTLRASVLYLSQVPLDLPSPRRVHSPIACSYHIVACSFPPSFGIRLFILVGHVAVIHF